jgi:hypothetical protein
MPLPSPSRDGSIELLRPYVNLTKNDFRLLVVWLAAAIWPVGPYPILALYGEQGSAKSTLARIVRLLIDPQAAPLLSEPRSMRDIRSPPRRAGRNRRRGSRMSCAASRPNSAFITYMLRLREAATSAFFPSETSGDVVAGKKECRHT